jgi:hypothetical protein
LRYEVVVIVVLVRVTTACGGSGRYHLLSDRFKEVWASQKRYLKTQNASFRIAVHNRLKPVRLTDMCLYTHL